MAEATSGDQQAPDPVLEARLAVVQALHGERIGTARMERVRASMKSLRDVAAEMYAYPLSNADEPGPVFAAWREE